MSKEKQSVDDQRHRIGDEFNRAVDPLKQYDENFTQMQEDGVEPFEMFLEDIVRDSYRAGSTVNEYERSVRHFKEYVTQQGRHPACANDTLVIGFSEYEFQQRDNGKETVKTKLNHVNKAYQYFQDENVFPHTSEYSPVDSAWGKITWPEEEEKEFPKVTREEMRAALAEITHVFKLAVILMGLKLGMRQGEIRNVQLRDIHIENTELQNHYPELGSHRRLDGRKNAIFIPSQHNRPGNKSERPRILPLDEEMRRVLTQYLLIRPDCGEPWVFLSQTHHDRIRDKDGINRHWKEQIRPHISADEYEKELTSHFGRHWFSTFWKMENPIGKEYAQYMRGDKIGDGREGDTIDEYLHAYYPDHPSLVRRQNA
ncbi:tyrosine-type recombinase/integrase [Natronorubrum sp. JWXQ-INN-674]|uniref:Tyrosine-type recombinase/integrase n=1 Tax=Natronorubrum halalkaliphilum TaxID=2691917 RepID=A0A6B0VPT7_9EURY|nr:tyrosine-type recombinase/integrase [Natronorubrum halalkaliphilum]MXV63016.1 tyrosine-type recombinase/integrase [Natronorubrum halalkaliphilum]